VSIVIGSSIVGVLQSGISDREADRSMIDS